VKKYTALISAKCPTPTPNPTSGKEEMVLELSSCPCFWLRFYHHLFNQAAGFLLIYTAPIRKRNSGDSKIRPTAQENMESGLSKRRKPRNKRGNKKMQK
jgi:hypothetical protein